MKVTIKRRTGTTVPLKLELVNALCVRTPPSHWKGPAIVSQSQAAIQASQPPMRAGADSAPPFWELEDLIANGLPREMALAMIAARRPGHDAAVHPCERDAPRIDRTAARYERLTVLLAGG